MRPFSCRGSRRLLSYKCGVSNARDRKGATLRRESPASWPAVHTAKILASRESSLGHLPFRMPVCHHLSEVVWQQVVVRVVVRSIRNIPDQLMTYSCERVQSGGIAKNTSTLQNDDIISGSGIAGEQLADVNSALMYRLVDVFIARNRSLRSLPNCLPVTVRWVSLFTISLDRKYHRPIGIRKGPRTDNLLSNTGGPLLMP